MIYILATIWIACGVIHYGFFVAYFQGNWPGLAQIDYHRDRFTAGLLAIYGPIALIATLVCCQPGKWGWRL